MAELRVGVFGGTFDPPHIGHAVVAREVLTAAGLDRVLWVPASVPPHKVDREISAREVRRRLVEAAIRDEPRFGLCELELDRGGVSYTVDTLRTLAADHPEWRLSLIVGADLFRGFASWREPEAIAELAEIIVISRPGDGIPAAAAGEFRFRAAAVTPVETSSSRVRERVRRNLSVRDMVTPTVLTIIEGEGLYGESARAPRRGRGRQGPPTGPGRKETRERR